MKIDVEAVKRLNEQFENATYLADSLKQFQIGRFKVYENNRIWTVEATGVKKEFSTRMAALSWAKFITEERRDCAETVEKLSEEFDGATAHLKQLIKTSIQHPAVIGKIDPAADKRVEKVDKLAKFILKNS